MDLEITTEFGLKKTDFLDVMLDLENGEYAPYRKPNDNPVYIDVNSDHPPMVKKGLHNMIQNRLSTLSCNKNVFNREKPIYETALKNAGHPHQLEFQPEKPKKRTRKKNVTYYTPPFSSSIVTDVGGQFLRLLDKHFPPDNPLSKHINRNKVKMSYSTCPNVKMHISKHNAKLLREEEAQEEKDCKCLRKYPECPVQGKCQMKSVVYKAEVHVPNVEMKSYIGLTKNEFIKRFEQHQSAMRNRNSPNATALSKYV